jgi:hypothetical protein
MDNRETRNLVSMNLEEALKAFESTRTKKHSANERQKICEVVEELGISYFKVEKDHISGVGKEIGIHRTMIVAGERFHESTDRGPAPYPKRPHFYPFSTFSGTTSGQRVENGVIEVLCSSEFVWVPVGKECRCGEFHEEE